MPSPLCSDWQPPFVTDLDVKAPAEVDEPGARQPFRDPVIGACLVRVTDRTADLSPDDSSAGMKNEYSPAVELKEGGRIVRLARTQALVDEERGHDYWAELHGSFNRDFTRILFTSSWGRPGTGEVEMYMIELPSDWPDQLP